jgi:hypothetical protein
MVHKRQMAPTRDRTDTSHSPRSESPREPTSKNPTVSVLAEADEICPYTRTYSKTRHEVNGDIS